MAHDSNPTPPSEDASFIVAGAGEVRVAVEALRALPGLTLPDALIASTGHPASGPFAFGGAPLRTVIETYAPGTWSAAQVSSGDGFGTRIMAREWLAETARPILLAHTIDGRPLPGPMAAVWHLPDGELPYVEGRIDPASLQIDVAPPG